MVSADPRRSLALAAIALVPLLSAASGAVDAVAYLRYDVFVANQTGNLAFIALGITEPDQRSALLPSLASVAPVAYALGAALGAILLPLASGAALRAASILVIAAVLVGQW
jgi:uncharacterized membrane protein YoaK (UPF0700 family)